ncbi:MAG: 2-oxoacid:acceptor oxidoreductase subunit alpha [Chloroflexota bacterium]
MAVNAPLEKDQTGSSDPIINDFAFSVATQNGSGSQTSNTVLVRTLFNMGIPVNGKNLFPSNIKGLPTWYTIRASKDGYVARRATTEIIVAYNQDTVTEDIKNTPAGGVVIYRDDLQIPPERDDVVYYPVPVRDLMKEAKVNRAFKARVENMTYVGVVAQMFELDMEVVWQSLLDQFGGKEKPARMNMDVIELSAEWAAENLVKSDPYLFKPMNETAGKILITGNEAAALGSIFGGVHFAAWYPITPSTSVIDSLSKYRKLRRTEDGKNTVAIVQAEDELAAAGMIIGAGFSGARSMTATSGPGISLMSEFVGLAHAAEIPCVFWNITRMGPSTGLPTRTSQGDILFTHYLGHGDSKMIVLLPATPEEAFEFGWRSLDIAEEAQAPVFVVSDLDLGMNNWMAEPFQYPDEPLKRGKVLDAEQLTAFIEEHGTWGRYLDVDGDGIPYRTLPGTDHPRAAYFARGTGHNEMAVYSERSDDWLNNMARLNNKLNTIRQTVLPKDGIDQREGISIGLISFGTNDPAIQEARDTLAAQGIETNYLRVRSLPLQDTVKDFTFGHDRVYVIENNYDGQLNQIMRIEYPEDTTHVTSLALGDGLPMTAKWIVDSIIEKENN